MQLDPVIALTSQAGIALLFGLSSWHKVRDFNRFLGTLGAYRLLPRPMNWPVAAALIALECVLAVGLLLVPTLLIAAAVLLTIYAGAIGYNILRENDRIDCGCVGYSALEPQLKWTMVIRNCTIAMIATLTAILPASARPMVWFDFLTVAAAVAGVCLFYLTFEATQNLQLSKVAA